MTNMLGVAERKVGILEMTNVAMLAVVHMYLRVIPGLCYDICRTPETL
jgi:hypothetical protein